MICAQKAKEEKAKKREPCDGLCQEWFSKEKGSLDARTYLADKLLPTLIPGVEKLLMEVERKDVLTSATEHAKFDPITFLGEYLMRHNPQYDTCTKPGPYLRGLDAVTEELKREIPDTASERLARMKSEVKTKRKEREQADRMKHQQKEMRKAALATQFKEWTADVSGRIPVYVHSYTENFPNDAFQEVLKHLSQCAADFQESIRRDTCKQMFIDLFLHCDRGQVGVLDRAQILGMLEQFYERSSVCARRRFCNPKECMWGVSIIQHQSVLLEQKSKNLNAKSANRSRPSISTDSVCTQPTRLGSTGLRSALQSVQHSRQLAVTHGAHCLSDLHPTVADIQSRRAPRFGSPFDGSCLNLPRFVQLMETFVGEGIALPAVKELVGFIKEEYKQTEEEKVKQLEKAHLTSRLTRRELLLEALFEKWDIDASGFLEMKEVEAAMNAFKEGMEKEAVRKAKNHFCSRYPQLGRVGKLSPKAFQAFLELVASELTGGEDEVIDNIVEFLTTRVERSHRQCLQSSARRRWLHNIQQAAESSGARMDPVYDAVLKDAEAHGDNKKISAYIALLEENQLSPERGQTLLRYVTCTTDDAPYVLNQTLYRDMKGVSFAAVEEKKPIHVPRVQLHGNIHFWNQDRPAEQRRGSFLVLPLQDAHWRVFGTLGLDTLRDQSEKTIFLTHEISFYQGVSHAFSKAYQHVCALGSVLQMALTALDWLHHRVPSIHAVSTYLVEPGNDQMRDYALRRTITTDTTGQKEIHTSPVLLLREENLFRDYLFKCIDCSEVVCRSVCGEQHIAVPLRDPSGRALGLFDISIRPHQTLSSHEHKELQRMLKMTQAACSEILKMPSEETKASCVLEAEHRNVRHAGILFHRLMLQDLRERIQKLNAESFAEIKSYEDPPALVHNTMKAVLLLLHPEWEGTEKIENWNQCILVRRLFLPFSLPLSDLAFLEVLPASFLQANLSQL
uniref:EF-hand calcium binding domain 5 n=1 Tax=Phasianus colchicus TaxID=9054 RepID=A0A669PHN5_PHACC